MNTDDEDDQTEPHENALKTYTFNGKELEPFSFERQCAAESLGLYSGSTLKSCAVIVFLCTLPDSGVAQLDSPKGRANFKSLLSKWTAENRITLRSENGKEVQRIGMEIFEAIEASASEPEFPNDGRKGAPSPNVLG